ncbi:MAG: hypothetical protein ACRDHZ_26885 [Ktedonobacteraceae bacterium]
MLKVAEIERLPATMTREITSPAQGLVLIDCQCARNAENEEPLPVPLHWRIGDWSKPPIDIALDEDTGHFQSLLLVLQDEIIKRRALPDVDLASPTSELGIPIFARTPWNNDELYVDEHLQPTLSWEEQSSLLVVFASPPIQITRTCLVDDSFAFLLNEQDEIIGFQLNQITPEERRMMRWASPLG